jgi:hypothetical protein
MELQFTTAETTQFAVRKLPSFKPQRDMTGRTMESNFGIHAAA